MKKARPAPIKMFAEPADRPPVGAKGPSVPAGPKVTLQATLSEDTDVPYHSVPLYYEIWNWEGDTDVLPGKWLDVVRASFGSFVDDWSEDRFLAEFANKPQFDTAGFFLVTHRSETVGTVLAWVDDEEVAREPNPALQVGRLHWLGVVPQHRRLGVAKALVSMALRYHKSKGRTKVTLRTEGGREEALQLYSAFGFEAAEGSQ